MSLLEQHIRQLSEDGLRINIWPTERGFQANVSERSGQAWTCHTSDDPIEALAYCLRLRAARVSDRTITGNGEPAMRMPEGAASAPARQLDIEEAIASVPIAAGDDPFAEMFG